MMPREIREEQIYEDLSIMLQIIKKKLMIQIRNPHIERREEYHNQQQTDGLLTGFRTKYAHITHVSPIITKVIERFFCRIREILNQIFTKIPRQRSDLLKLIREFEQFNNRPLNQYNHLAIISFLDLIGTVKKSKQLVVHQNSEQSEQKQPEKVQTSIQKKARESNTFFEGQRKISEVQLIQKNAQHYLVMDIDAEHVRGRYFDLKSGHKSAIQNDMAYRNRFIKQIIKSYQLEYDRYKRKQPNYQSKRIFCRFRRRLDRWDVPESVNSPDQKIQTIDPPYFSRITKSVRQRRQLNASSNMVDRKNRENKIALDTFRSLFQQKLSEKKQNIKIKNMVMNLNGSQGRLKDRALNQKRIQFYKKSQDQVRLRYKYYNYNNIKSPNTSKGSIKYRTINPQSTFNTIGT